MIKVLHYIPGFLYGGIENMYLGWYSNINKDEIEFDLLLRTQDDDAVALKKYRAMGGKYYRLPRIQNIWEFRKGVVDFFKAHHDYDILHTIGCDPFILSTARKYGTKKVILHSHTSSLDENGIKEKIERLYTEINKICYVDRAFACSELAADWLFGGLSFKGRPVTIIRNAIDCERYDFNRERRNILRTALEVDGKIVIGHVGRLTYQKNQFYLLDIFSCFKKKCSNAILLLIGDGPDENELKKYADCLGISESVRFLGVRDDIPDIMQAMDLFLLPSRYEGLPLTEIEAQAAGLPCLVSDQITQESEVTDLVSRLSTDMNPEVWAERMMKMIAETVRKSCLCEIKDGGFDIYTETQRLTDLYMEILSGKE